MCKDDLSWYLALGDDDRMWLEAGAVCLVSSHFYLATGFFDSLGDGLRRQIKAFRQLRNQALGRFEIAIS